MMHTSEFAEEFCRIAGIEKESIDFYDAYRMLENEAQYEQQEHKKKRYSDCLDTAFRRMVNWHNAAHEIRIRNLCNFIAVHRIACVWVVLHARKTEVQ